MREADCDRRRLLARMVRVAQAMRDLTGSDYRAAHAAGELVADRSIGEASSMVRWAMSKVQR